MNASNDNVIVPSLHDTITDAGCRGGGFADEQPQQDADAFPHDDDYPSDEDWARMEAHNAALRQQAPPAPAARFAALEQYPDADLIDAVARVDDKRWSDDWVGIDATGAAPDEAHPTIPGFILRTDADKSEFLAAVTKVLLGRLAA